MDSGKLIKAFMENTVKGFKIVNEQLKSVSESNIRLLRENRELKEKLKELEDRILLLETNNGD